MVRAVERERNFQTFKSLNLKKMFDLPGRHSHSSVSHTETDGENTDESANSPMARDYASFVNLHDDAGNSPPPEARDKPQSDMELMKERLAKLLLGEDMSGSGKGVSSALALSNAITNVAASVFGEQKRLEPMSPDRKARWKKEIEWLLSVTDHIVEFVPSHQSKDGINMEVMVTRQRADLQMNIPALRKLDAILIDVLDQFGNQGEFWYVSRDKEGDQGQRNDDKWWVPLVKVLPQGLSDMTRRWINFQKDSVNQVLKAAMAINAEVLAEMAIPDDYMETLPKNGRASLGDSIYKSITVEHFDPVQFFQSMDLSSEHKVLDLKNRIEASIVIWRRKMHQKDGKSSWGSVVSIEKREIFEERVETILFLIKQQFPGIAQSVLDISKIQFNKDIGQAILESYSRVIESLAFTILSRIDDVLYADSMVQNKEEPDESACTISPVATPTATKTLSDFMGWKVETGCNDTKKGAKVLSVTPKKLSYLEKLENLSGLRSPTARH